MGKRKSLEKEKLSNRQIAARQAKQAEQTERAEQSKEAFSAWRHNFDANSQVDEARAMGAGDDDDHDDHDDDGDNT